MTLKSEHAGQSGISLQSNRATFLGTNGSKTHKPSFHGCMCGSTGGCTGLGWSGVANSFMPAYMIMARRKSINKITRASALSR